MKKSSAMAMLLAAMLAATPAARAQMQPQSNEARVDAEASEVDETADLLAWDSDDDDFTFDDEDGGGPGPGARGPMAGGSHMGPGGMRGGPGMHGGIGMPRGGMGMRHGGRGMRGGMMQARLAQLDLTEAQRERMQTIREAQQRKGIQMRADLQLARLDMAKLMRADKPDQSALHAQIDRMARLRADAAKARVSGHLEMRSVLTAEQLKKMREHKPMQMQMRGTPGAKQGAGMKKSETLHR